MEKKKEIKKPVYNWHAENIDDVYAKINSCDHGLSNLEGKERLVKYGANSLPQKKATPFILMLLKEFINPIVIILLVAMVFFICGWRTT